MTTGGSMHSPDTHSGSEERNRMPITQSGSEEGRLRHRPLSDSEKTGSEKSPQPLRPAFQLLLASLLLLFTFTNSTAQLLPQQRQRDGVQALSDSNSRRG